MKTKDKIFTLPYEEQMSLLYEEVDNYNSKKEVSKRRRNKVFDTILDTILMVLVLTLLSFIILVFVNKYNNRVTLIFSYSVQYITTGSMAPTLPEGSIIVGKEYDKESDLTVGEKDSSTPGDIITFYDNYGNLVTHRAIYSYIDTKGNTQYETKGDNNEDIDPFPVSKDQIVTIFLRRIF